MKILALDLEGTLISNAMSQYARPGLYDFLEFCLKEFPRVVIYSAASDNAVERAVKNLVEFGDAPKEFASIEIISWGRNSCKDLNFIPNGNVAETVLVDDQISYICPNQMKNWIPIEEWDYKGKKGDTELHRVKQLLRELC